MAQTILVERPELIKKARERAPSNAIVVYRESRFTTPELPALDRAITTVRVIHSMPRNAREAELVHPTKGRHYGADYWSYLGEGLSATGVVVDKVYAANGVTAKDLIAQKLASMPAGETAILLGHVEGGAFRLSDGTELSVAELSQLAVGPVIFLGCNTMNHIKIPQVTAAGNVLIGTGVRLQYGKAIGMVGKIHRDITQPEGARKLRDLLLKWQEDPLLRTLVPVAELLKRKTCGVVASLLWHLKDASS